MPRLITNSLRSVTSGRYLTNVPDDLSSNLGDTRHLPRNAKLLAWAIFLLYFIENGTLGLLPKNLYFVYRNVRISDFILYGLIIYSLFSVREYSDLFNSRSLILIKILFAYLIIVFIGSAFAYKYNVVEFFFRLKTLWASFLIFPYLLLIKRKAFPYLVKLIFPFAVVSSILYILSSLTGTAYLPDISIVPQIIPGGFKIYRVYGGTFFGEVYFLGYIYFWITKKFKFYQLFFVILFILPQILAFGRGAWMYFIFTIFVMFVWNSLKGKNLKIVFRQIALVLILLFSVFYVITNLIPESSNLTEALESRVQQGEEDFKYKQGTYGTRVLNTNALINLWLKSNVLVGIGMHPLWVIKPVTEEEAIYYWGLSDLRGPGVLAVYGLVGFILYALCQIYYGYLAYKILKKTKIKDIYIFFIILFFSRIIFFTFSINLFIFTIYGLSFDLGFYIAVATFKYEHL